MVKKTRGGPSGTKHSVGRIPVAASTKKLVAPPTTRGTKNIAKDGKDSQTPDEELREKEQPKTKSFPVVGIGASAGGLEALQALFKSLRSDTGMVFVVVQHLDPTHESHFSDILARATKMTVAEAVDGMMVAPDHVYIIPPNSNMTFSDGVLKLCPRLDGQTHPASIDIFLLSLAKERKNKAIGVILSGTGSDGTKGLSEIKAEGGITFVQDKSARFDGMPKSAIAVDCVDFILPPEGIAKELQAIGRHAVMHRAGEAGEAGEDTSTILKLLRRVTGLDFTFYKQSTIERRIDRRMVLHKLDKIADYVTFLKNNASEVDALQEDLLIKVTSFFRDPEVFESLSRDFFPRLMKNRSPDVPIRAWVVGCCTGEEVYSIAMCLLEFISDKKQTFPIQIFGTDVSEQAVEKARAGIYTESVMNDVSDGRRRRFFNKVDGGFQISKTVREMCVFAKHNIATDPPFSGLDLISCRNVFIYFESTLQKRVLSLLHYSLKPTGFLLLGTSESLGTSGELFAGTDSKHKIFSKKLALGLPHFDFAKVRGGEHKPIINLEVPNAAATANRFDLARESERAIRTYFAPDGVVINDDMEVLQVSGRTDAYLWLPPGEMSHSLLKMARPGLLPELRAAILKAKKENVSVRKEGVRIGSNGNVITARVQVIPIVVADSNERYFVVLFWETSSELIAQPPEKKSHRHQRETASYRVAELETALATTEVYLQALIDKEQAANEELKSVSEETMSSNEELRSTNEELETAKEELQSTNEELSTVNDELQNRNNQLGVANNDLNNVIMSVRVIILIVGRDLRIRRFTPGVERVMKVAPHDIGRPLSDIQVNIDAPDLVPLITKVIDNVEPEERQVHDAEGRWMSMWIRPYVTGENKIDGAIITIFDIDALRRAKDFADTIVQTVRESLLVLDGSLKVKSANQSFYEMFRTSPEDTVGRQIYNLGGGQWNIPALRSALEKVLAEELGLENYEISHDFPGVGYRTMLLNARRTRGEAEDAGKLILLAMKDITQRKEAEIALKKTADEMLKLNTELEQFAYVASHDLQEPLRMVSMYMDLLAKRARGKLDKEEGEFITIAINGARRMKDLVGDLLAFSRTGKEELKYEPTDCSALVDECLTNLKMFLEASKAEVSHNRLPTVMASGTLLGEVFQNLIVNAIKFRGDKPPKVHISSKDKESEWEFAVKDNGIGIEKRHAAQIFQIFQRLHTQEAYPGTGIGLATCKKIVERYGGRIWIDSELGIGSTFFFTIPKRPEKTATGGNW